MKKTEVRPQLAVKISVKSVELTKIKGGKDRVIINGLEIGKELSGVWMESLLIKAKVNEHTELTIYYNRPSLLLNEEMENDLKKIQEAGELLES